MKTCINGFIMMSLSHCMIGCFSKNKAHFGTDSPQQNLVCELPFPTDLVYQATPDSNVLIGTKKVSPAIFEISGYAVSTAQKLWQLPFLGEIVGQTTTQVLVYEEKTSTVHFVNPKNGQVTRSVSPAPSPLTSKNGLAQGMAFTDEMYLTPKSLYTQVIENGKIDESFPIGITAKTWETNQKQWFLPPVRQIIILDYPPVIVGDKVFIINPEQKINEGHSYQTISLQAGKELHRSTTEGTYYWLENEIFMERTNTSVKRINPFTQKEIWRIDGEFTNARVSAIRQQITVATPSPNKNRTIRLIDADTGNLLCQCILPDLDMTQLEAVYAGKDNQLLLHFKKKSFEAIATNEYDYWVNYDLTTKQTLWHTDMHSESISSLMPFMGTKIKTK
jgi:hypothetical protein